MRARDVLGRRIVRVDHTRWYNPRLGRFQVDVDRIVLDDGSVLYPLPYDTESGSNATIKHLKPNKKGNA